MDRLMKFFRHNEGLVILIVLIVISVVAGCNSDMFKPKTASPITGEMVTLDKLELEYSATLRRHDTELDAFGLAVGDIESQNQQRAEIWAVVTTLAAPQVNTVLGGAAVLSVIGNVLLGHDNRRKDTIIKRDKSNKVNIA
jgi:hypothetical protein